MDAGAILQAISSLGFPIVICLIIMWYVKYMTDEFRKEIRDLRDSHREESKEFSKAVENNTQVLTVFTERLGQILNSDLSEGSE